MAASRTFELEQFQKGYIIAWTVTTQCMNTLTVTITEGTNEIAKMVKENKTTDLQVIGQDYAMLETEDTVRLTVKVNESTELKTNLNFGAITNQKAKKLGYVYNICIEDYIDEDYNDVNINIVGWAKKG